jgi:hypothetical protein
MKSIVQMLPTAVNSNLPTGPASTFVARATIHTRDSNPAIRTQAVK